jgi:acyl carrier protein
LERVKLKADIKDIFVNELGIEPAAFTDDLAYGEVPEWDSASHMVIVLAIEEKFGVEFESDDIVALTSVRAIYDALQGKGVAVE